MEIVVPVDWEEGGNVDPANDVPVDLVVPGDWTEDSGGANVVADTDALVDPEDVGMVITVLSFLSAAAAIMMIRSNVVLLPAITILWMVLSRFVVGKRILTRMRMRMKMRTRMRMKKGLHSLAAHPFV